MQFPYLGRQVGVKPEHCAGNDSDRLIILYERLVQWLAYAQFSTHGKIYIHGAVKHWLVDACSFHDVN